MCLVVDSGVGIATLSKSSVAQDIRSELKEPSVGREFARSCQAKEFRKTAQTINQRSCGHKL
jgi:hypothetical protein